VPFVVAQNGWFEWTNALWLLQVQTENVRAHGLPGFFVNSPDWAFYPMHLFYAGPLFSALAYPSVLFGAWPVFAATSILAFIGLAVGVYWMARSLGVPGPYAAAPALLFATTPYIVSNLYGRGAWTELISLSGLSLVFGSATALLAGAARRRTPFAVLVVASFVLAGTHNITLLWSVIIGVPLMIIVILALGLSGRQLLRRGLVVLSAAALGSALCACFLVPDVALSHHTVAAQKDVNLPYLRALNGFETPPVVFNLFLVQPRTRPTDMQTQTATVALMWTAAVGLGLSRRLGRRTLALVGGAGLVALVMSVGIFEPGWWSHLPSLLWATQFTMRLVPYLTLALLLAMMLLLRSPAVRQNRWATAGLVLAVAWQVGLGGYQSLSARARVPETWPPVQASDVKAFDVPRSFDETGFQYRQFRLVSGRLVVASDGTAVAPIVMTSPLTEAVLTGGQPAGSLVATNVVYSPLLVVRGTARLAGRDGTGLVVLAVTEHGPEGWRATVTGACPLCFGQNRRVGYLPVEIGETVTLLALATSGVLAVLAATRSLRARTRRRGAALSAEVGGVCERDEQVLDVLAPP
jgi:hypothetical protein